jgi:hypothetical protein
LHGNHNTTIKEMNKPTTLYRPNSDMDLEGYKDLISYHLTELYHQTDQLDVADARQQDEIDYLRKRVELLEITIQQLKK